MDKVNVLLRDGRTVPIVAAVELPSGQLRFVDTLGRQFRPDQVVSYEQPVRAQ